ncbi:hypothetical protein LIER_25740 [Lithospermum erythrorhizon]|uniref:Uncharacterized protein n=1 Tax=Lithospermum erythrorhizon TaxID=34254 RepID=A0AAV3R5V5_LITER
MPFGPQYKSDNKSKVKKQKTAEPVIYRRSLRLQGASSDVSASDGHEIPDKLRPKMDLDSLELAVQRLHREKLSREVESFSMSDAYTGNGSDRELIDLVRSFSRESGDVDKAEVADCDTKRRVSGAVKLDGWDLKPENVAQVVPGWIMDVKFFPTTEKTLVVAGNKSGNVGFWNVDAEEENGNHIYLYNLHTAPVSGLVIEPFSMSKIFTSSHDGFIRLMDIEREVFDSIYTSKYPVNSISGKPHDKDTIYFSEGHGVFDIWDLRAGSSSSTWKLHRSLIHTIDFNQENSNLMATSCSNGTACIWDLRKISTDKPVPLTTINHKNGVQSAYFSPSGRFLATTSIDLTVGISSGANYKDTCRIPHLNIGKGVSAFRGIWGWDDSYVYIGNMRGGIDVISASEKKIAGTFDSENMAAVPYRFDAHRYRVGMLVGATSVGQVYVCTSS